MDHEGIRTAAPVQVQVLDTVERLYRMRVVVNGYGDYLAERRVAACVFDIEGIVLFGADQLEGVVA